MATLACGACCLSRASAVAPRAGSLPTSTRSAPMAATRSAVCRPIPEVAPVMMQTLPCMNHASGFYWHGRRAPKNSSRGAGLSCPASTTTLHDNSTLSQSELVKIPSLGHDACGEAELVGQGGLVLEQSDECI